ncbi:RadC family protein [Vibrio aphrogenes]|uniref:RadC family protein n=1 Tax=Vibrio aphrogenes TaxID=1891186 RepID=UPI000B35DBE2|nr:DNA repair protein RadC [Vibrio aphrogenes]
MSTHHYPTQSITQSQLQVLEQAAEIVESIYLTGDVYTAPQKVKAFLQFKLTPYEQEVFGVMFLNNQHQLISFDIMFKGTVNAASVYPREVAKLALQLNASAIIATHNHPSGQSTPSQADIHITQRLKEALELIDVRMLDHIIIGKDTSSLAELGHM